MYLFRRTACNSRATNTAIINGSNVLLLLSFFCIETSFWQKFPQAQRCGLLCYCMNDGGISAAEACRGIHSALKHPDKDKNPSLLPQGLHSQCCYTVEEKRDGGFLVDHWGLTSFNKLNLVSAGIVPAGLCLCRRFFLCCLLSGVK